MLNLRGLASGQYIRLVVGLAASPLLARGLGASDRGTWALIASFDIGTTLILTRGLPQAFSYEYLKAEGDEAKLGVVRSANQLLARTATWSFGLATVALLAIVLTGSTTAGYLAIPALLITTPAAGLHQTCRQFAVVVRRDWWVSVLDAVPQVAQSLAYATLFFTGTLTLTSALVVYVTVRFFSATLAARLWPSSERDDETAALRQYGWRALPSTLGQNLQGRVDQISLLVVSREAVGIYAVGALVGNLANPLYLSAASQLFRSKAIDKAYAGARRRMAVIWLLAVLAGGCAVFLAEPVFGEEFSQAGLIGLILAAGSFGFGQFLLGRAWLDRNGFPHYSSAVQIGHVVLVAAIVPVVAYVYGLVAVALATMLLQCVRGVAMIIVQRQVASRATGLQAQIGKDET